MDGDLIGSTEGIGRRLAGREEVGKDFKRWRGCVAEASTRCHNN